MRQSERASSSRWSGGSSAGPAIWTPRAGVEAVSLRIRGSSNSASTSSARPRPRAPIARHVHVDRGRRPLPLRNPASWTLGDGRARAGTGSCIQTRKMRLVHDSGLASLEPVVEPAQALLQEADRRPGNPTLGIVVRPRPDQALARPAVPARKRGSRWCSRRSSRRPCRPDSGSRRSPRTRSLASRTRRGADGRARPRCSAASPAAARATSPAIGRRRCRDPAGGRCSASIVDAHESMSAPSTQPPR